MAKISMNKSPNVMAIVKKLAYTILSLYVGGFFITILGNVMNGTCSPFYSGLKLIGWTVASSNCSTIGDFTVATPNTITATSGTSILGVIGLIGIASVVLEFVNLKF